MNRKERLYNTFQGKTVDRPAVNFYEINGYSENPDDPDEYNIYNDPSWKPLIDLAREKTDRMVWTNASVIAGGKTVGIYPPGIQSVTMTETVDGRHTYTTVKAGKRILTSRAVREKDVNTSWCVEHLIKDLDDLKAWTAIPDSEFQGVADIAKIVRMEKDLGDTGCPMLDLEDPLCIVACNMTMLCGASVYVKRIFSGVQVLYSAEYVFMGSYGESLHITKALITIQVCLYYLSMMLLPYGFWE